MTTEMERDAVEYINAAVAACKRRLALLDDAYKRGVHTQEEYERLRHMIITEVEETWCISLEDLL